MTKSRSFISLGVARCAILVVASFVFNYNTGNNLIADAFYRLKGQSCLGLDAMYRFRIFSGCKSYPEH
ncbi:MAG: hypothetical protein N3F66_08855 [Spirochaetes bacterium]|nr:hypothetical protein [Spirochaetota bacterium]